MSDLVSLNIHFASAAATFSESAGFNKTILKLVVGNLSGTATA